jgi:hypothetical protein
MEGRITFYIFWLPLWYLLVIVLFVPPFTASDCPFDIFWSLCYLSLHLKLLIAPLISFDHCVICPSIYSFCLPLWYLLVIVLFVPPFTASDCPFGIFWSLYCLSFHFWFLITSLVSFGHFIVCRSWYQRGNQMEWQKIQWSKDTKEVIRWNDRKYNDQKIPKR